MFYIPNLPYAFYLAIKAKHPAFFSAANPSIKSSGNGTESKYQTLQLIPKKYRPKTVLIKAGESLESLTKKLHKETIEFPLIAKPNIGFRGLLVQKIENINDLKSYVSNYHIDVLLQEYLDYKNECGIFYLKKPNEEKGTITSITLKKFLTVVGNGKNTLKELIVQNSRAKLYSKELFQNHSSQLDSILEMNQVMTLSVIGNHSKGTQFINGNHLISEKLERTFDTLSNAIEGWYYGRIDIKYNSFTELENGDDFKILEINGIIAEPTHIYDSQKSSYLNALKEIRNHWKSLYEIANINHIHFNVPYKSSRIFMQEMRSLRTYTQKIKKLTNSAS